VPKPDIVSVSCIRNEEDVLEAFVRYHCARVRHMVIADHESEDASPRILERLRQEGLPLLIRRAEGAAYPQAEILTSLAREALARFDPDWVLPLDADEFIIGDLSRLAERRGPVRLPWQTYVPTPADEPHPNVLTRIVHRKVREEPRFEKVMVPRAVVAHPAFRLCEGSHCIAAPPTEAETVDGLRLAHFPVRSSAQVRRKAGNYARRLLVPGRCANQSYHLKALVEACRERGELSVQDLQRLAATYAALGPVDESLVRDPVELQPAIGQGAGS
jgi:hypothetical protein